MTDVLQVHPCKENRKKMLTKRTGTGTGKVPQDKSCYNLGQNRWKICTPPPHPPNQGWENGAFWLCAALSLILGGRGIAVPYFSVQDCS